ncbi:MAG: hypothetical protein RM021_034570 [Nostoc sp. EkiNYC01]|nr:hypothetical protein [Nostoc sp. EkiNYC01]
MRLKQVASRKSQVASKFCDGDLDPDTKLADYRTGGLKPAKFVKRDRIPNAKLNQELEFVRDAIAI